jgi:hypothetical protein
VPRQSLTDKRMIGELERGREQLLSDPSSHKLLSSLRRKLESVTRNIYVVRWIPEQTEDLYDVLVDETSVVQVQRDAHTDEVVFEKFGIEGYLNRRLTKPDRRKLELALRLAHAYGGLAKRNPPSFRSTSVAGYGCA